MRDYLWMWFQKLNKLLLFTALTIDGEEWWMDVDIWMLYLEYYYTILWSGIFS